MTQKDRHIHIDHLVLPAGAVGRQRIRDAVERELTRLAQAGELDPHASNERAHHREISTTAKAGSDPRTLAKAVGAAIKSKGEP